MRAAGGVERPAAGDQALRRGERVFAAVDVPADQVDASLPVTLCGMQARIQGLLRLAQGMHSAGDGVCDGV